MKYTDIDKRKQAFVFELDNVIYPEKDYLFQVYYLFASAIELPASAKLTFAERLAVGLIGLAELFSKR